MDCTAGQVVRGASLHLWKGVLLVKFVGRGKAFFAYKNAFGTPPLHVRSLELEWFVYDGSDLFVPLGKETSSTIATFHFWSKIVYRPGGWGLLAFRAAAAACLFGLRLFFLFGRAARQARKSCLLRKRIPHQTSFPVTSRKPILTSDHRIHKEDALLWREDKRIYIDTYWHRETAQKQTAFLSFAARASRQDFSESHASVHDMVWPKLWPTPLSRQYLVALPSGKHPSRPVHKEICCDERPALLFTVAQAPLWSE